VGVGGSFRTSGRFRHRCREKIFRPPLDPYYTKKWILTRGVLDVTKGISVQKRIFLKTKQADQKQCENWRVSLVQNSTNIPERASEVSCENSCEIHHSKFESNPPWLTGTFSRIFWSNDVVFLGEHYISTLRYPSTYGIRSMF